MKEVLLGTEVYQKVPQESTSLFDLLVTLIIGVIAMIAALFGIYSDIPAFVIGGSIVFVAAGLDVIAKSGKSIFEFMRTILDFIDYLKDRRNRKNK